MLEERCHSQQDYVKQALIWRNAKASNADAKNFTLLPNELKQQILFELRPNWMPYQKAKNMLEKMEKSIHDSGNLEVKCFPVLLNNSLKMG